MGCESNGSILLCISSCRLGKSWCVQHQVNGIPSNIRLAIVSARSDVCGASNSTWSDMFIESTSTPYGIIIWNGFSTSDSSSSSCSHLAVRSLRQTQFSSSQFCHGLRLSSFRWLCMSRLTQSINICFDRSSSFSFPRWYHLQSLSSDVFLVSSLYVAKLHQSCFPAPLCYVLYFQFLPDVIVSYMVS